MVQAGHRPALRRQAPHLRTVSRCTPTALNVHKTLAVAITEAQKLSREIQKQGYRLTSVIVNRVPGWVESEKSSGSPRVQELILYYQSLENELQNRTQSFTSQQNVYKCFEISQNTENVVQLKKNYDQIIHLS